jgi:hypothetical protein
MGSLPGRLPLPYPPRVPTRTFAALAVSLALAGAARAQELPLCARAATDPSAAVCPGGVADLAGPRTLGLSAAVGAAAGNDGIYLNPGALAARKRYSIETGVLVDRRGAVTADRFLGGSIVDSQTSAVTGGVSFLRAQLGVYTGNVVHLAFAGPVAEKFYLGVTGKYLSLGGPENVSAATADAGVFWQVADLLSVGFVGYNLVPVGNEAVAPMGTGAGIAIGSDRSFQLTGDWRADFDRLGKTSNRWAAGLEVLLAGLVPLRAGWMKDEVLDTQWWSAGIGLVSQNGVAVDVGYRQSFDDPSARTVGATLKLFLGQ